MKELEKEKNLSKSSDGIVTFLIVCFFMLMLLGLLVMIIKLMSI